MLLKITISSAGQSATGPTFSITDVEPNKEATALGWEGTVWKGTLVQR